MVEGIVCLLIWILPLPAFSQKVSIQGVNAHGKDGVEYRVRLEEKGISQVTRSLEEAKKLMSTLPPSP